MMMKISLWIAAVMMMLDAADAWAPAVSGMRLKLRAPVAINSRSFVRCSYVRKDAGARMTATASGTVVETVDAATLELALKNSQEPLIVDFSAESRGCGPCLLISPQLEQVAKEYVGKIRIIKIDTDKFQGLTSQMKITALPTLIFYNEGQTVLRVEGAMMSKKIKAISEYAFFGGAAPKGVDLNSRVWEAAKIQV